MLTGEPRDGILQIVNFLGNVILEPIYFFVHSVFHNINSLIQLGIDYFLLFLKVTYHFAKVRDGLFHWKG